MTAHIRVDGSELRARLIADGLLVLGRGLPRLRLPEGTPILRLDDVGRAAAEREIAGFLGGLHEDNIRCTSWEHGTD